MLEAFLALAFGAAGAAAAASAPWVCVSPWLSLSGEELRVALALELLQLLLLPSPVPAGCRPLLLSAALLLVALLPALLPPVAVLPLGEREADGE